MRTILRSGSMFMVASAMLALGACQQLPTGGAADGGVGRLTPGETSRGELTSRSSYNVNDGSRFQRYAVALEAGQVVRFDLTGALNGSLSLHAPDGEFLAASHASHASHGGQDGVSLSQRADAGGVYVLSVSGQDHRSYGPFRLSSRLVTVGGGGPLQVGDELAGWLDEAVDTYVLEIAEQGLYQITMRSDDLDAYLTLRGTTAEGEHLHLEDDDSAGGLDALLTAYLPPGRYEVDAGWTQQQSRGLYTLAMTSLPVPAEITLQQGGALVPGQTVEGWMAGAPIPYTLVVNETARVRIDMTSTALDPYLELMGDTVMRADDDGGEGFNARIETLLPAGAYQVLASDVSGEQGLFALTATVTPFDLAAALNGLPLLRPGADGQHALSGPADHYRLVIPEQGRYTVEMRSRDLDAFLELYGDTGAWQDDDGGTNTDALLSLVLPAGEYLLVARAFDHSEEGDYQLLVRRQ